jgi:hypothetical protein
MALFEFLMILLSIIVGLGLAEILTGIARFLRDRRGHEFRWIHSAVVLTVFMALLQVFWESWGLQSVGTWTFSAMLLMLSLPIVLFLIAHLLFPTERTQANLEEYYFDRSRLIWSLALAGIVAGNTFRPLAFGEPLFIVDNLSSVPSLISCLVLISSRHRTVHLVLASLAPVTIFLDTITINYTINQ